ncbi:hypothetical protein AM500_06315 [Bacillus sp. FJAT-18017]|uniref:YczE/YyaS/YitT family protein n=1 Tax=Bacillus sp. FJAT-18017 TaxID=1705566 RepID=UPI0006BD4CCD|nr:hypothetical protein [Bacillus sp. FJAT-18017]ALC89438.1 hypothetical protein AM500_06315 [Bacillus sp. FJAT-18017]
MKSNLSKSDAPKITPKRIIVSMIGIALVCIGVAFNNNTMFGNDPIGMFYDGIRNTLNFSQAQLGYVSNFINIGLIALLWFFGRKYVNIGTFLYLIPYGLLVSFGSQLYVSLFDNSILFHRVLGGMAGISMYYVGISLFVASNIGVDPFNGAMLTIRDKTKWSIQRSKITMDFGLMAIGFLLGGKFGIITIITALTTGPAIQYLSQLFGEKLLAEKPSFKKENRINAIKL